MSDELDRLKAEIEVLLAKFKRSTDLAEKQTLLKRVEFVLGQASEIALATPDGPASRKTRAQAKTHLKETGH
jgi:hypothetical protein